MMMKRYSTTDFRANISNGGSMMPFEPHNAFCELAVNSNSHITGIYNCTGINVAEYIFRYILYTIKNI